MKGHMLNSAFFSGNSRPTSLQDRGRDSDDEDFRNRDYDVAALASNLS
jgi:serine/threonine-protein phosphatase 6 regulatory subunit 3